MEDRYDQAKIKLKTLSDAADKKASEIAWLKERANRAADTQKELNEVSIELREARQEIRDKDRKISELCESVEFHKSEAQLREKELFSLKAQMDECRKEFNIFVEASTSVVTNHHALLMFFYGQLGKQKKEG